MNLSDAINIKTDEDYWRLFNILSNNLTALYQSDAAYNYFEGGRYKNIYTNLYRASTVEIPSNSSIQVHKKQSFNFVLPQEKQASWWTNRSHSVTWNSNKP